jgi:hypothetical protein
MFSCGLNNRSGWKRRAFALRNGALSSLVHNEFSAFGQERRKRGFGLGAVVG